MKGHQNDQRGVRRITVLARRAHAQALRARFNRKYGTEESRRAAACAMRVRFFIDIGEDGRRQRAAELRDAFRSGLL
jgi:hypothetical protein